jgi:dihydrofolate reductase
MVPGGARLIRTLLDEGLIDEMRFCLDPIVAGAGLRLFADNVERIPFVLADEPKLSNGVRYIAYRPA